MEDKERKKVRQHSQIPTDTDTICHSLFSFSAFILEEAEVGALITTTTTTSTRTFNSIKIECKGKVKITGGNGGKKSN